MDRLKVLRNRKELEKERADKNPLIVAGRLGGWLNPCRVGFVRESVKTRRGGCSFLEEDPRDAYRNEILSQCFGFSSPTVVCCLYMFGIA